jgi:hypothetical protein
MFLGHYDSTLSSFVISCAYHFSQGGKTKYKIHANIEMSVKNFFFFRGKMCGSKKTFSGKYGSPFCPAGLSSTGQEFLSL